MKRLLSTTTAIAVALGSTPPLPLFAQTMDDAGRVIGADGSVLCEPTADAACDLNAIMQQLADQQRAAEEAAAAEAAAAEAAAAEAAAADAAAAEAAAAEAAAAEAAAAEAAAAEAAAAEAQRAADEAAAAAEAEAQKAAEEAAAAAAAEAQKAADDAAAAAEAEAQRQADEAAAAATAEAEAQKQADDAAAVAEAEAQAAADAEAQKAAEDAAAAVEADSAKAAEDAAAAQAAAEAQAAADVQAAADAEAQAATDAEAQKAAEEAAASAEGEAVVTEGTEAPAGSNDTTFQGRADFDAAYEQRQSVVVIDTETAATAEAPPPTPEAVDTLETLLVTPEPEAGTDTEVAPTAEAAALSLTEVPAVGDTAPPPADAVATVVQEITEADTRSSAEEFLAPTAAAAEAGKKKKGLSDLEKVGLIALGALVVGAILKNGDRVEQNTGDRVVVQREDGSYVILKDDDTLLRRPGSTIRAETFRDGSTRTIVERADGSRVITIRDAAGRVLRRAAIDARGRETLLIDDLIPVEPIDLATLPRPSRPVTISAAGADAALAAAMAAVAARDLPRSFSLRQIRDIAEVRALAPVIDVEPITFASGSSAIAVTEAEKLADLGRLITQLIAARPNELFLIEGHTDAVGSAASNLTLSDRRAESVALALTEYFGVPPENLVVQGYGEGDLVIQTDGNEPRNRRVAARLVTPLLAAAN